MLVCLGGRIVCRGSRKRMFGVVGLEYDIAFHEAAGSTDGKSWPILLLRGVDYAHLIGRAD